MTSYLLDTNILLRATNPIDPLSAVIAQVVTKLISQGDTLHITAQNIVEFWAVATRPSSANGLGWNLATVAKEAQAVLIQFPLLDEKPDIFNHWLQLVSYYGVQGKQVHDLRLVAVMQAHGVSHLLTFNKIHFVRYSEIIALSPGEVI